MFAGFNEAFSDMTLRQDLDNLFNNVFPNFIGTTAEGARIVKENPAVQTGLKKATQDLVGGQYGKQIFPRIDTLFQSRDVPVEVLDMQEQCKKGTIDGLIGSTNPAAKYRCGWLYQDDPNGINPVISSGWLGTQQGPFEVFDEKPRGEWFWNLQAAKQKMELDRCAKMQSCSHIGSPLFAGKCGWCQTTNRGIAIDSSGNPAYPNVIGQSCATNKITRTTTGCPVPQTQQVLVQNPQTGQLEKKTVSKDPCAVIDGRISQECLIQQAKAAGCTDEGSLIKALEENNNPNDRIGLLRPNMAYMVYQERAPQKLTATLLADGRIGVDTALSEFSGLAGASKSAQKTGIQAAAFDLCTAAGSINEFDFCTEVTDTQTPPYSLDCLQKEFKKAGGNQTGAMYPTEQKLSQFQSFPTWRAYKDFLSDLAAKTRSTDITIQEAALRDLMGINRETLGKPSVPPINAYEVFALRWHSNDDAVFMGRYFFNGAEGLPIIDNSNKIPGLVGNQDASFVLISDLRPTINTSVQFSFPPGVSNGISATLNSDRERLWERYANAPNDYRRDFPHNAAIATNEACTNLKKGGKNYLKVYFNQRVGPAAGFRMLMKDCNSASGSRPIPTNWIYLNQEIRAPMLSFEVRNRSIRGSPKIPGMHEYRMPEFFIADNRNILVEDRPSNAGPNDMKFITFESTGSKWEVNKLITIDSWQCMSFCFRLNRPNKAAVEAIFAARLSQFGMQSLSNGNVSFFMPGNNPQFAARVGIWYNVLIVKKSIGGFTNNNITIYMYEHNAAKNGVTFNEQANRSSKTWNTSNPLGGPGFAIYSFGADSSAPVSAGFSLAYLRFYDYELTPDDFKKDVNNKWVREWFEE